MNATLSSSDLTQVSHQSIIFTPTNDKIAYAGILEHIDREQWHVFTELRGRTKNINVINLASLLAVFPRIGIYAYEISQNDIAAKMAAMFDMPTPARSSVSKWECELQRMGLLQIPRHVDWRAHGTKMRVITPEFWNMARRGLEKISYTCPHVTYLHGKSERVKQVLPENSFAVNSVSSIRARSRADQKKNQHSPEKMKFRRPPKSARPHQLGRFENSIVHWLFQHRDLVNYREGIILCARFLEIAAEDDFISLLRKRWTECTDSERPGHVGALIKHLRAESSADAAQQQPAPENAKRENSMEKSALRNSLFLGEAIPTGYGEIVREFRTASQDRQDQIIRNLEKTGML
jgi:hypothetical protein